MFFLHSSNKTENLLEHLIAILNTSPLSSPFEKEVFLIQSQGMERWLSQQIAERLTIWANFEFLFPGKFFSAIAKRLDSRLNDASLDRGLLLWRFEALLRQLDDPVYQPLQQYLKGENLDLKRFQLAQQLAKIFDQYQIMRPDLLACWQQGEYLYRDNATEYWQRKLWLALSAQIGSQHRGSLWLDMIAKFHAAAQGHFSSQLPERISIFGINSLPPLFLDFLQGLAQHCDVHLYLMNPSEEFWADLDTKRQHAKSDLDQPFNGHPLLASLGQQGREFQSMLLNQTQFNLELTSFEASTATTLLQHLQNDILSNQANSQTLTRDHSIGIHACHSRLREVEVLKNQLVHALENDAHLELRDIVIMAPDIQDYEPFIAAVFNDFQYAIADRSLRISNTALEAFIRFLHLSQSRFGWQSVLDLLEQTVVYTSFGLDENALELLKTWLKSTQVRWGKSAQHKQELGLPALSQNTWQATLDRLLMGYCVGNDAHFVADILPFIDIEGSNAEALGGLNDFLQLLFKASSELHHARPLADWYIQLSYYADQLLANALPLERQQLNELLTEFSEQLAAIHTQDVALSVIISWLETRVSEQKSTNGFLRGQLTFCSMLPMRSIPFKVIALIGMNNGEFPKIDRQPSFDLLTQYFRKGDRSSRFDDRYQFLEILLSTRQQLIITYLGQSINSNEFIQPSIVINELLEVLHTHYQVSDLITLHPLQAFSPRYFKPDTTLLSYVASDCATAIALNQQKTEISPWWQGSIHSRNEPIIEINELFNFFKHPQRYFMQRQLDVRFNGINADPEEREPFSLAAMDRYAIQHQWIEARLKGDNLSVAKLQAQGNWLSGICGELEFMRQQAQIEAFVARIQALNLGIPSDDWPVDLSFTHYRLIGTTRHHYENASLFYRYADLKGKDFIVAWLQHLIMNQVKPHQTHLLSTDFAIHFLPEHAQTYQLEHWLTLYQKGQQQPDAFFCEPAFAYIKQACKLQNSNSASKPALEVAIEWLARSVQQSYEPELQILYQNQDDLSAALGAEFEGYCQNLLQPIWQKVSKHAIDA